MDLQDLRLAERFRELDLRQWLNENTAITTIAAVVLLMIALGVMLMTLTGGGGGARFEPPTQKYFYDLNTGELFAVPMDELPPIERGAPYALPNGQTIPAGVEAVVFAPQGGSEDEYVVGWVETLRPEKRTQILEAKRQSDASQDVQIQATYYELLENADAERLVMDPSSPEPRFVPRYSEPGYEITGRSFRDKAGEPMRPVYPK